MGVWGAGRLQTVRPDLVQGRAVTVVSQRANLQHEPHQAAMRSANRARMADAAAVSINAAK